MKLGVYSTVVTLALAGGIISDWSRSHTISIGLGITFCLLLCQLHVPKSKKRSVPVSLIILSALSIYQTITKDGAPLPQRLIDIFLLSITIIGSFLVLKEIGRAPEVQAQKINWKNGILLNVLALVYALLVLNVVATPVYLLIHRLWPAQIMTRIPQIIFIVIWILVYVVTFKGWMPFTGGRKIAIPVNPVPVDSEPIEPGPAAHRRRLRPRFVFDAVLLGALIFLAMHNFYKSGVPQLMAGLDPVDVYGGEQNIPRSKNFPDCPKGTTYANGWEMSGNGEWCVDTGGQRQGPYLAWYTDDKKSTEGAYEGGLRAGLWRGWNFDGKLSYEGSYQNGRRSGDWIFHKESGPVTVSYKNDVDCAARWKEDPWLFIPGHCIGPVTPTSTLEDSYALLKEIGTERMEKTLRLPYQKPNAFMLSFLGDGPDMFMVNPSTQSTAWHTPGGIRMNQTLADLEKKNGKPISLGRNGSYAQIISWNGGALESEGHFLQISVAPARRMPKLSKKSRAAMEEESELEEFEHLESEEIMKAETAGPDIALSDDKSIDPDCRVVSLVSRFYAMDPEAEFEKQLSSADSYFTGVPSSNGTTLFILRKRELRAIDSETGSTIWTATGAWNGTMTQLMTDKNNAILQTISETLMFDGKSGRLLWSRPGRIAVEGYLTNRLVSDGSLYFIAQTNKKGTVEAVDQTTGKPRWSAPGFLTRATAILEGGNILLQNEEGPVVRDLKTGKMVYGLNHVSPKKGRKKVARRPVRNDRALGLAGTILFLTRGRSGVRAIGFDGKEKWAHKAENSGTYMKAIPAGAKHVLLMSLIQSGKPQQRLEMINTSTGRLAWSSEFLFSNGQEPWIDGETILFQEGATHLRCRDIASGKDRWSHKLSAELGLNMMLTDVKVTPKIVLVPAKTGTVLALDRSTGKIIWRLETHMADWPAFMESAPENRFSWIGTSDGTLYSVDPTGRVVSKIFKEATVLRPLTMGASTIVFSLNDGYAGWDIGSGEAKWTVSFSSAGVTGPVSPVPPTN